MSKGQKQTQSAVQVVRRSFHEWEVDGNTYPHLLTAFQVARAKVGSYQRVQVINNLTKE